MTKERLVRLGRSANGDLRTAANAEGKVCEMPEGDPFLRCPDPADKIVAARSLTHLGHGDGLRGRIADPHVGTRVAKSRAGRQEADQQEQRRTSSGPHLATDAGQNKSGA